MSLVYDFFATAYLTILGLTALVMLFCGVWFFADRQRAQHELMVLARRGEPDPTPQRSGHSADLLRGEMAVAARRSKADAAPSSSDDDSADGGD